MTRSKTLLLASAALLALLLLTACSKGDQQAQQATPAAQTEQAAPAAQPAATAPADSTVATHDCAGGCGMTNWPEDQMTEIDGKWYCAGCAAKVKADAEHAGHDHGNG